MESYASASTSTHNAAEHAPADPDVHSDDEPMVDPATGQKIPRPRNAWILYRKTRLDDVPLLPDGSKQPMAKASSIISHWWKTEVKEVRMNFEMLAAAEKAEHKRRYPDYKYKPRTSHQIAMAKEKKKAAKKSQYAKEKEKKTKPKDPSPPPPLTSSVHTSYLAAALANQAARPTTSHGPEGPSPPLSLASTPITTPSPLPLSDFEQGSSSTAATSHSTYSPGDGLGLSLAPASFNFGEHKSPLRARRHLPARIAPRPRGTRQVSTASMGSNSRVPSSSSLVIPSPATSTPASLSPLSWHLTSQQPSPQSGDDSLSADLIPHTSGELYWGDDSSGSTNAEGAVSIDLEFNPSKDSSIFADLEYFNTMGMPMPDNNEGVFQLPAAPFLDAVPGQIDVNLLNFEASDHERDRFAAMLNDFDFSAFQAGNMSLAQNVPSEILGMPDTGAWENWGSTQEHQASTSEAMSNRNVYASHAAVQSQQSMMSETSMASEYGANEPAPGMMGTQQSSEDSMQAQQANQHEISQQGMPAMSFSPDVLADPDFQAMFARYLEQKHQQSQQHGNNTQQTSHYTQQLPIEQIRQPQPQYSQQPLQYQPQYASKAPQQMQYDAHEYAEQQHAQTHHGHTSSGPSTPAAASASQHTGRYVPPAGAMRARARRVAGSWRPPAAVQQETWSAPQTPVDCAAGSRLPSWAGVPN